MTPQQLPKELQVMYQRTPEQLQRELNTLPLDKQIKVLEELTKLHYMMERGVYELALGLVRVLR